MTIFYDFHPFLLMPQVQYVEESGVYYAVKKLHLFTFQLMAQWRSSDGRSCLMTATDITVSSQDRLFRERA
jgi:hypothetical protein